MGHFTSTKARIVARGQYSSEHFHQYFHRRPLFSFDKNFNGIRVSSAFPPDL